MSIILASVITSLIVSIAYSRWFTSNLTKFMADLYNEQEKYIRKVYDVTVTEINRLKKK